MCVRVLVLRSLLFPSTRTLSSDCKTGQADFTDWVSFLPSNLMAEISPNP